MNFSALFSGGEMAPITKEAIHAMHKRKSRRICFGVYSEHLPKNVGGKYKINLPFGGGFERIFPYPLMENTFKAGHVWGSFRNEVSFQGALDWCVQRSSHVFLYDCLSFSAAVGFNKVSPLTPEYTGVGRYVAQAKETRDDAAIGELIRLAVEFIGRIPLYLEADYICAVPAPHKPYDLPRSLAAGIATALNKPDITGNLFFGGVKGSAREIKGDDPEWFNQKWAVWEGAAVRYNGPDLSGKKILLIDDNYQSGLSLQHIAMILQQHGASEVFGLCMTKTLGDNAN